MGSCWGAAEVRVRRVRRAGLVLVKNTGRG